MTEVDQPLWEPSSERAKQTRITQFARWLEARGTSGFFAADGGLDYAALHAHSVQNRAAFWSALWEFADVVGDAGSGSVGTGLGRMAPPNEEGPRWFPSARINFAENLLRRRDAGDAIVSWTERGVRERVSFAELRVRVHAVQRALVEAGVGVGDRVAGFVPNTTEAVVAMLATASLGGIWSSCSPDFGAQGVLDRFGQIAPKVLIAADGYSYAGKQLDLIPRVREILSALPAISCAVVFPFLHEGDRSAEVGDDRVKGWYQWIAAAGAPDAGGPPDEESSASSPGLHHHLVADHRDSAQDLPFVRLPFDHPLYIMYSSGTTGLPKCMVHGAGGTLLQHLKEHILHTDLSAADRVFYFSTCGWMMWNWLVSALAVGATIVLYDGAPLAPSLDTGRAGELLWQMAEEERLTVFGTSAKYLALMEKEGLEPKRTRQLSSLRTVLSTGSPLAPDSFDYVYRAIASDLQLSSISGGTDIISCFILGNPAGAVWRGELQVPGLGMAVDIVDAQGCSINNGSGELVCTLPFPSMPVRFWNDDDGTKYRAAYFDHFPGVWRHGDWAERTSHGGFIITGRSDATLNPGGVRIGTAEIYRQVEQLPEVLESVVIGQEIGTDVRIVLFVRLRPGTDLTDQLRDQIRSQIRRNTTPHHVPKVIAQVADIPRTISGKISEVAVRDVVHGRSVKNTDALANPSSLDLFKDLVELSVK